MNLFINDRIWNNYAKTIAMEDIYEECELFLPQEEEYYKQSIYKEGM